MLASDVNNPAFQGAHNPDDTLWVEFFNQPEQNNYLSLQHGKPVFEDKVMVKIIAPGDSKNIVVTYANDEHKKRFPRHWAHFQNTQGGQLVNGTPIDEWSQLTRAQAMQLKAIGFNSVEQVAGAGDDAISRIGMVGGMSPVAFRDRARAFLTVSKGSVDEAKRLEAERALEASNERIAALEAKLEAMINMPEPKRRGRPPKEAA